MAGRVGRPRKVDAPENQPSLKEMLEGVQGQLAKQQRESNLYGYKPHDKQALFHKSEARGRLYIGGNRSGKSVGGVVEDLWWATGRHPYVRLPTPPIRGRVVGVDFINGVKGILFPIFKRWVIPSDLINGSWEDSFNNEMRTLNFTNGSEIEFKSYDQDLEKHAGTSRHFIHFDEEPPRSIYGENMARIVDTGGRFWITMTPVEGMTWVYHTLYMPWKNKTSTVSLDVIEVKMSDNAANLPLSDAADIMGFMDETEREKREHGSFVPRGGKVFPAFSEAVHATIHGWYPPEGWGVYHSVDHGFNNPTAHLYHAVSPDGLEVVTFKEFYGSFKTIKEWATEILEWEAKFNIQPFLRTGDPAMKQRTAESGLSPQMIYAQQGIHLALDSVPRAVEVGVDRITEYLQVNPRTKRPFWQISDCPNLIRELGDLQWDYYENRKLDDSNNRRETIKKKNDHAPDSARYFFTFLPDLSSLGIKHNDPLAPDELGVLPGIREGTIWDILNHTSPSQENQGWAINTGFGVTSDYWED